MNKSYFENNDIIPLHLRLSSRITGIIFWSAVLTGFIVVTIFIKQNETDLESRQDYQMVLMLRVVENILTDEYIENKLSYRTEQLKRAINSFKVDGNLIGAEIQVGLEKTLIGSVPINALTRTIESNHTIDAVSDNKILLTAYFDPTSIIYDIRKNLIVFVGLISFMFGLLINYTLKKLLTNPIDEMIETASTYAKGDRSTRFDDTKDNEFGFMSQFINMALDSSEHMQQQLKESVREQRIAKESAEKSLKKLEQTQSRLIESEKLASLGQLTAGIAHEIQNPLNFINNFSETSVELFSELQSIIAPHFKKEDNSIRDEVEDILEDLSSDLKTIGKHGKRADSIIKNMLMHSRTDTGEQSPTDINTLINDSLNLAYQGEQARTRNFHVEIIKNFTENMKNIMIVPQDISRVLINLFSNSFYAINKGNIHRAKQNNYTPTIIISTQIINKGIEIRIRDNGIGISEDNRKIIFTPFFTTKPAGEGTGLGLSICYDIIVKQNEGHIEVKSIEGEFTEFIIWLPYNTNNDIE